MKFLFFLTARYPTEKAYGITTGNTAKALLEEGHQVEIISPSTGKGKCSIDEYGNLLINHRKELISNLERMLVAGFRRSSFFFNLNSILLPFLYLRTIRNREYDVIWVRDPLATLVMSFLLWKPLFVVEIHHRPRVMKKKVLKLLSLNPRVLIVTIQESLRTELEKIFPESRLATTFMAVDQDFLKFGKEKIEFGNVIDSTKPLRVCLLGRLTSSGNENGVEALIRSWQQIPKEVANLTIVGFTDDEQKNIEKLGVHNITFMGSISHKEVPKVLSQFDCGILPYLENDYNRSRFPIKSVEYAASGLVVVASNTIGHKEVLGSSFAVYYDLFDESDLYEALKLLQMNPDYRLEKSFAAFQWAKSYTYKSRVKIVSSLIEGQRL